MQLDVENTGTRKAYNAKLDSLDKTLSKKSCDFADLEAVVYDIIATLPKLDLDAYHEEAKNMLVKTSDNPTTFQLLEMMDNVQQYKNRLSEIMIDVDHECAVRKRTLDMLNSANDLMSNQKSSDKRHGEASLRFPNLLLQLGRIEAFRTELQNIMNNLKSIGDVISRQASILSLQIQLGEYRKKMSLDFNRDSDAEENNDYKSGAPEIDWENV